MLTSIKGVYRNGQIELIVTPVDVPDETQVIIIFLSSPVLDLSAYGIVESQAAEIRVRLSTFAEDWDSPSMDVYNHH